MHDHWWRKHARALLQASAVAIFLASSVLVFEKWLPGATSLATAPPRLDPSAAATRARQPFGESRLQALLERETANLPGTWGVAIYHLGTGETAQINTDHVFTAASLYKLIVMCQAFVDAAHGDLDWNERLTFTAADAAIDPPNMEWEVGTVVTAADAVDEMIVDSSNSAAMTLLRRLGIGRINALAVSYGLPNTQIGDPTTTTPAEMLDLLKRIADGNVVDQRTGEQMIAILKRQIRNDRIPRYLPAGLEIAHKTGELGGIRHDAGIVYAPHGAYIVVLMVEDAPDGEAAAEQAAQISRAIYDYFEQ